MLISTLLFLSCIFYGQCILDESSAKVILSGDNAHLVWAKWRHKFPSPALNRADAEETAEQWAKACLAAHGTLDAVPLKPFEWKKDEESVPEMKEILKIWIPAVNKLLATRRGKRFIDSPTVILGDQWAIQLAASFEGVWMLPGTLAEATTMISDEVFFGSTRTFIAIMGKDCIMEGGDHQAHFEQLKKLLPALPPYSRDRVDSEGRFKSCFCLISVTLL